MPKGAIMRPETYSTQHLLEVFMIEKILTLKSVASLLGDASKRTAVRKLGALKGRASYSHAGKYYTLDACADYDKFGLWSFKDIHFSKYGTLINTILQLVSHSEEGYFAFQLQELLKVRVHNALTKLYSSKYLVREQIGGEYLYLCPVFKDRQLKSREQVIQKQFEVPKTSAQIAGFPETIQDNMRFLIENLNEQQRRLYLGLESIKLGHGGDRCIAQITGIDVKTIARGRRELETRNITADRIRRVGAGRPPLKKKLK